MTNILTISFQIMTFSGRDVYFADLPHAIQGIQVSLN